MNKKQIILLVAINVSIAVLFFVKNIGVGYSQLSSDLHNIIPMCMKLDNPDLYKNDLYLTDTNNFKYYTPFFIKTTRFFGNIANGNYVLALNYMLFITHLIYGVAWFLIFYKLFKHSFWVALIISILIRGIVWLPGFEIWGISDLWTLVPRTIYSALLPIPFIILFSVNKYKLLFSSFLIGLIFNFHPISGLAGILIFITLLLSIYIFYKHKISIKTVLYSVSLLILGMLPFLVTYFSKTELSTSYDLEQYKIAFNSRIPIFFSDPLLFMKKWIHYKTLFFLMPLVFYSIVSFSISKIHFKKSILLLVLTLVLLIIPAISIPIENWVNSISGSNLRMSFQLIRIQKFAILPSYFALGFLIILISEKFAFFKKIQPGMFFIYIFLIAISNLHFANTIPFISDDITKSIIPSYKNVCKPIDTRKNDFDKMAKYISKNVPKNATFYNTYALRSAAKKSVRFDHKGASILIEGNPKKLIKWNKDIGNLKGNVGENEMDFFKKNGVNYLLSKKNEFNKLTLIKNIGNYKLYKIP